MTEKGTKTLIGAFVLGAVALLVAGVLLVGTGTLSRKNVEFVLYFDASLRGLVPGSPVYFKGVRVGKVMSIQISADADDGQFRIPVVIELENALITGEIKGSDEDEYNFMSDVGVVDDLIRRGLRAKLGMQSFITGQLTVDLDMLPDATPVNPATLARFRGLQQIPTVPSSLEAMLDVLGRVPLEAISKQFLGALQNLNQQLEGMDLPGLTASLTALSNDMRAQLDELPPLRRKAEAALADVSALARHADGGLDKTFRRLDTALADVSSLTRTTRKTMDAASRLLREDSAPMLELSQTMQALRDAAVAVSNLATLLELKPDALIFGRDR